MKLLTPRCASQANRLTLLYRSFLIFAKSQNYEPKDPNLFQCMPSSYVAMAIVLFHFLVCSAERSTAKAFEVCYVHASTLHFIVIVIIMFFVCFFFSFIFSHLVYTFQLFSTKQTAKTKKKCENIDFVVPYCRCCVGGR